MYKDFGGIMEQFDWVGIVNEAIVRRQEEGLSQKKHTALAGVSIPTMISFEKAETTISIEKVLAILDVVGMVAKPKISSDKLQAFATQANAKWFELTKKLDKDSLPAKHPYGYTSYAFRIHGQMRGIDHIVFYKILDDVAKTKYSGWSPFWIPTSDDIKPYVVDNQIIECWLGTKAKGDPFNLFTASTTDFWRASKEGYMYLQRGYQEDSNEDIAPKEIFDLTIPIRIAAEVICYAGRLARARAQNTEESSIELHVKYTGLQGRLLANWSDPASPFFDKKRVATSDIAEMSIKFDLNEICEPLHESVAKIVYRLLKELYTKFNFYELQYEFIEAKLKSVFSKQF